MSTADATARTEMGRNILRLLGEMFRARPLVMVLLAVFGLILNARGGLYVGVIGAFTQALIDRDREAAIMWAALFLGTSMLEQAYWPTRNYLQSIILDSAIHDVHGRVLRRAASAPLEAFESGAYFARLQRATDNIGQRIASIFQSGHDFLQVLVMMTSILVPFWLINPLFVPILIVGFIPSFITHYRTAKVVHEARLKHATGDRLLQRLGRILIDRDAAAELRLFGNGPELVGRWLAARTRRADDVILAEQAKTRAVVWGEVGVAVSLAAVLVI
ncbi:MAG TPA: hypothetical protein VD789_05740, partial [Thermomicrobiales bacterium]|nr:hypothetical protein [Thermomicrobiales bacterium]